MQIEDLIRLPNSRGVVPDKLGDSWLAERSVFLCQNDCHE